MFLILLKDVLHMKSVISCYSTKNADGTALMSSGWCDHEKMKRHKWQPTEEHGEDQISHQAPGISARKNVYRSAARRSWTEEHSTLTRFITPAMLYARLYWRRTPLWCLTRRTSESIPSWQDKHKSVRWGISALYMAASLHFEAVSLRFSPSACEGNSPQLTFTQKNICLSLWKHLTTPKTFWYTGQCVRRLAFGGLPHQASPLQHFPLSL